MSDSNSIVLPKRSKDLSEKTFGRLSVIEYSGEQTKSGNLKWKCRCQCGNLLTIASSHLLDGSTQSCGCLSKEVTRDRSIKHGHAIGGEISKTYSSWEAMIARCTRPSINDYKNSGGRGILVCDRWKIFSSFLEDMGERPYGYQIDRIDSNGNYEPTNCRWATTKEQSRNKRSNNRIELNGEIKTLIDWAEQTGIPTDTLWHRIYTSDWTIERALTTPLMKRKNNRGNYP